jgi:hypothetical protein
VDAEGLIRLAYRSHDPTNGPAVTELLALLRELKEEKTGR